MNVRCVLQMKSVRDRKVLTEVKLSKATVTTSRHGNSCRRAMRGARPTAEPHEGHGTDPRFGRFQLRGEDSCLNACPGCQGRFTSNFLCDFLQPHLTPHILRNTHSLFPLNDASGMTA